MDTSVTISLADFLAIGVVGTIASLVIDWLKNKYGTTTLGSKAMVVGFSIVLGGGYYLLRDTQIFATIVGMLAASSTVYALFLKKSSTPQA